MLDPGRLSYGKLNELDIFVDLFSVVVITTLTTVCVNLFIRSHSVQGSESKWQNQLVLGKWKRNAMEM